MLRLFFLCFMTALSVSVATATALPRGCEVTGFGFRQQNLVLNDSGEQAFFLIQNRSNKQIELRRLANSDDFMAPQLQSKVDASNWSAFASDIQNLNFQCFVVNGDEVLPISCADVLEVCQYPRVKFALSNMGNYWVSTNKSQAQVIKDAVSKGIWLRW